MSILGPLAEKPWLTPGVGEARARRSDGATGLVVFLVVVTMLFAMLTMAYLLHRAGHGAGSDDLTQHWHSVPKPPLLWVNTAMLLLSSVAWQAARHAARHGQPGTLRAGLLAGGVLGMAFVAGQITVWRQLREAGYFLSSSGFCVGGWNTLDQPYHPFLTGSPGIAFFYLITALHGLHLIGGLAVWGHAGARLVGSGDGAAVRQEIDLCGLYWHFLLIVWLLMFGLFLMT